VGRRRENRSAIATDTSSSAAGSTVTVEAAAAVCAPLSVEPIFAKSVAAVVISSGTAITLDIAVLPPRHRPIGTAKGVSRDDFFSF
jgi:hypothetical protein